MVKRGKGNPIFQAHPGFSGFFNSILPHSASNRKAATDVSMDFIKWLLIGIFLVILFGIILWRKLSNYVPD